MKAVSRTFAVVLLVFIVASCAPMPQDYADAERTRLVAEAESANAAQARAQQHYEWTRTETWLQHVGGEIVLAGKVLVWVITVTLGAVIIGAGAGASIASVQTGWAVGKGAILRAQLLHANPNTGRLPAVTYINKGLFQIMDPATGSVMLADTRQPADRALVQSAMEMQIAFSERETNGQKLMEVINGRTR